MKNYRNNRRPILGILLVVFGLVWGVNTIWPGLINIMFDGWWTLFIIVPCLCALFTDRDKTGPAIGLTIGVLLLLSQQGLIDWEMLSHLFLAALIVILGLRLAIGGRGRRTKQEYVEAPAEESCAECSDEPAQQSAEMHQAEGKTNSQTQGSRLLHHYDVSFGERREQVGPEPFYGADIDVSFGALRLDLTDANIQSDVVISVDCSFGGVTLIIPSRYEVQISAKSAFGGIADKRAAVSQHPDHIIRIVGQASFAGVEVR